MIRVNLLKSSGATASVSTSSGGGGGAPPADVQKEAGKRFGVILAAIAALYLYNMFVVQAQQERLAAINNETSAIDTQKTELLGPTAPLSEKYNSEEKTIKAQLEVLRVLARNRLREVKALDSIQSLMSDKTWLRELKTEDGLLSMSGYSLTDDGITDLIRSLDGSAFFSDLVVKSTSEERMEATVVKRFDVEFKIGARSE